MKIIFIFLLNILLSISVLSQAKIAQAKSLFDNKKYIEANKILISIDSKDKDFAEAKFYQGKIAFEQKKYEEAPIYFEKAIEANNKIADYHFWLGNSYGAVAEKSNPLKQATLASKIHNAWETAAELDPKNIQVRWALITFYLMAPAIMGGSTSKAKEMASEIRKINPADGHRALGFIYQKDKKMAEAEKEYIEMARLNPSYTASLASFYIEQKLYAKALPIVENALKENPNDYSLLYMLGKISALSGMRLDAGQESLEKYLAHEPAKNEPSLSGANMRLAQIFERKGNKADAKIHFEMALKSDPKMKEASEGLARVSK